MLAAGPGKSRPAGFVREPAIPVRFGNKSPPPLVTRTALRQATALRNDRTLAAPGACKVLITGPRLAQFGSGRASGM